MRRHRYLDLGKGWPPRSPRCRHGAREMHKPTQLLVGWALTVGFLGCAGAPPPGPSEAVQAAPPPSTTKPEGPSESASPVPAVAPVASVETAPPPAASAAVTEAPAASDSAAESSHPSRSPIDVLTSSDTAFVIDYAGSAPIETARRTCGEKFGTDPELQAKCSSDARAAFKADVIRFRKDGSRWSWTVYKRDGSRLDEVTSGRVEFSEESLNSVKLKFITDKGLRPLFKNKREAVLTVPNDYSFEVDDADWGKLEYEAKIGLVGN